MRIYLFLVTICWSAMAALAQQAADSIMPPSSIFQYFEREQITEACLELDVTRLLRNKMDDKTWRPAVLLYKNKNQEQKAVNVEVRPKGHARRKICDIPPLKIRFSREFLIAEGLSPEVNILESVLICKEEADYEQFVFREYAVYRLYNLLTDRSLRAHLLKLDLKKDRNKAAYLSNYAFFIEPERDLATRLHGRKLEPRILSSDALNRDNLDLVSLFEFMIGNTDWAIKNRHNINTILVDSDSLLTAVPYDFDYAGIVNTPYAVPGRYMNIPNVKARYFMGPCREEAQWRPTFALFESKKDELLRFCTDFPHFDASSREFVLDYLKGFYELIGDAQKRQKKIYEHCGAEYMR
jgi:hypothetical protein